MTNSNSELAHYGVPGMRWGKRRGGSESSSGKSAGTKAVAAKTKPKKEKLTTEQIQDARARHNARISKIIAADNDVRLATSPKAKSKALATVSKYGKEIANSDDARIGSKMTKGEKAAAIILLGPLGVAAVGINSASTRKPKS